MPSWKFLNKSTIRINASGDGVSVFVKLEEMHLSISSWASSNGKGVMSPIPTLSEEVLEKEPKPESESRDWSTLVVFKLRILSGCRFFLMDFVVSFDSFRRLASEKCFDRLKTNIHF